MPKALSHVHGRSYFGEFDSGPLAAWLNSKQRKPGDQIEQLLRLNAQLPFDSQQVKSYLGRLVSQYKLAVAPVLVSAAPNRWTVDWRLVGRMHPSPALALVKLLHLADKGLLGRIRQCGEKNCPVWFYAKFEHMRFCSAQCQQASFRSDPEWRKYRAEYMKNHRQEQKLREREWLRASKRKGKG